MLQRIIVPIDEGFGTPSERVHQLLQNSTSPYGSVRWW
jgi:hypothetical protein